MIPDYQTCMLPLLKYTADNKEHKLADAVKDLSDLSYDDKNYLRNFSTANF